MASQNCRCNVWRSGAPNSPTVKVTHSARDRRKHQEAARMAAFTSLVHFIRHYNQASRRAPEDQGRRGRQISRQLIQVYRRYQTAALAGQQAPKVFRKGWDPPRFCHDRIKWELRMIFSDSVTQQFSDPHSIGFKVPYPEFEKLTLRTRDILFLLLGSASPFCTIQSFSHLPRSRQLSHPPSSTSAEV